LDPGPAFQHRPWTFLIVLILVLLNLVGAFFTAHLWPFIPFSIAFTSAKDFRVGYAVAAASLLLHFGLHFQGTTVLSAFDLIGLSALYIAGMLLIRFQRLFRPWPKLLMGMGLAVYILAGFQLFSGGLELYSSRWDLAMESELVPQYVPSEGVIEPQAEKIIQSVLLSAGLALFATQLMGWVLYGLILWQVILSLKVSRYFVATRFWREFSVWRLSDWFLIPLVLGIAVLIWRHDLVISQPDDLGVIFGWNLLILTGFAFILRGLSLVVFMVPRLNPLLLLILLLPLLLLQYMVPTVLAFAGFLDIWFDFRKRIRSNP